jgi:hypothetical protein
MKKTKEAVEGHAKRKDELYMTDNFISEWGEKHHFV